MASLHELPRARVVDLRRLRGLGEVRHWGILFVVHRDEGDQDATTGSISGFSTQRALNIYLALRQFAQ